LKQDRKDSNLPDRHDPVYHPGNPTSHEPLGGPQTARFTTAGRSPAGPDRV